MTGRAAALGAAACLALASCGGPKEPPAYPYIADRPRVLYATGEGLSAARGAAARGASASSAPNASIMTADSRSIVAAINGFGYARIEADPAVPSGRRARGAAGSDGVAYRVVNVALASSLEGLTTAGIWPTSSGFALQLYRDPFTEPIAGRAAGGGAGASGGAGAARLFEIGAIEGERALPCPAAQEGFELFALFPARDSWLGELRRDGRDSVELSFFAIDGPLGGGSVRKVGRAAFEAALSPLLLYSLQGLEGASLRSALAALGAGPFMARVRSPEGADAWYLSGGAAEEAEQAWAWSLGSGRVLALSASGVLADAGRGPTKAVQLGSPCPGASYSALACAGGIVAAAWEAGTFPEIAAAGLVIAPLGR
jgi:hypothetical protein